MRFVAPWVGILSCLGLVGIAGAGGKYSCHTMATYELNCHFCIANSHLFCGAVLHCKGATTVWPIPLEHPQGTVVLV